MREGRNEVKNERSQKGKDARGKANGAESNSKKVGTNNSRRFSQGKIDTRGAGQIYMTEMSSN